MPIVQANIKTEILSLLNNTADLSLEDAKQKFASDLAIVIENALKSAIVTVQVTTIGSATTQAGTGTGYLS